MAKILLRHLHSNNNLVKNPIMHATQNPLMHIEKYWVVYECHLPWQKDEQAQQQSQEKPCFSSQSKTSKNIS